MTMKINCSRWFHVFTLALGLALVGLVSASAADNQLVVTVDADASAKTALGAASDECTVHLSARVVYVPNPVTGRFERSEEQYTLNAGGAGRSLAPSHGPTVSCSPDPALCR